MKRKAFILLTLALAVLLCGCQVVLPALPTQTTQAEAATTVTAAPQTVPQTTAAPETQPNTTEAPPAPATTEAPPPTTTETPPPPTTTEAPPPPTTTEAPGPQADPYFSKVDGVFTNSVVEIFMETGSVIRREIASGNEKILYTPEQPAGTTLELIGVTEQRLYFGWNEEEDWWGLDVYSTDYQGGGRKDLGTAWDPEFHDGWLFLYGFRSDVSPTELRIIDRNDKIVLDELKGAVWSGAIINGSFYYVWIKDIPENWEEQYHMTDVTYQVIRLDPDNSSTVLTSFYFDSFYHPAFITDDGKVNFYEEDGSSFSYDLFG